MNSKDYNVPQSRNRVFFVAIRSDIDNHQFQFPEPEPLTIDSTVVFTHIYDGIVDVKAYTYDGDVCVEAERVYTFPTQMSALRHYRDAIERAELYDDVEMFNNQVRYKLKDTQYQLETKDHNKHQLKAKFDKQIADAKADMAREKAKRHEHRDHHEK